VSLVVVAYIAIAARPFSFLVPSSKPFDAEALASVVVSIYCQASLDDQTQYTATGSGTVLLSSGLILTNEHVVTITDEELGLSHAQIKRCRVIFPDLKTGTPREVYWANSGVVPGLSAEYDLAYLQIDSVYVDEKNVAQGTWPKVFPALYDGPGEYLKRCGPESSVDLGDQVWVLGYPAVAGIFSMTMTEGTVSGFSDYRGMVKISAKIDHGHSGGLVVDRDGCMVGVPSAGIQGEAETFGLMIPTSRIKAFEREFELLKKLGE
jgi:S1-C subfamily serine protease